MNQIKRLNQNVECFLYITHLDLTGISTNYKNIHFPQHLKHLKLVSNRMLYDVPDFKNIASIHILTSDNQFGEVIDVQYKDMYKFDKLKYLIIEGPIVKYSQCHLMSIFPSAPNLESLKFIGSHLRIIPGFPSPIRKMQSDEDNKKVLKYIQPLRKLTHLTMSNNPSVYQLNALKRIVENLTSIDLSDCCNLKDLRDLKNAPKLNYINLSGCNNCGYRMKTQLHDYDSIIKKCKGFNDNDLKVLKKLPKLETLILSNCFLSKEVFDIIKSCKSIKYLDITGSQIGNNRRDIPNDILYSYLGDNISMESMKFYDQQLKDTGITIKR